MLNAKRVLCKQLGLRANRGQTTAEYAIIVALVAIASIAIVVLFGGQIRAMFARSTEGLAGKDTTVEDKSAGASDAVDKNLTNF